MRLCQVGRQTAEELRELAIQPGMLPDFPDSEVSGPLYQLDEPKEVSVQPNDEIPQTEVQDKGRRTEFKKNSHAQEGPHWLPVEDTVMQDVEPRDQYQWKVPAWLAQNVQPQDSVSRHGDEEEPMIRANHGASDQNARKQLWKRAQIQSNRDGKPRIPVQTSVKEAPDIESLAAKTPNYGAEKRE